MTKKIIFNILFLLCAFTSTFVFHLDDNSIFVSGLFPGLLFISTTIVCATFVYKPAMTRTLKFATFAYFVYLAIFSLTFFTAYVYSFVGIIAGGLGSLAFFALFDYFIMPINYNNKIAFAIGALAFIINGAILFNPIRDIIINIDPDFFRRDIYHGFSGTFFIWQFAVGARLTHLITAKN